MSCLRLATCLWLAVFSGAVCAPSPAAELDAKRAELAAAFNGRITALAGEVRRAGLKAEADETLAWIAPHDPRQIVIYEWPAAAVALEQAADASPARRAWLEKFAALRKAHAEALFAMTKESAETKQAALAWDLAAETLRHDPDHAAVRAVWGFQRVGDEWHTAFAAARLRAGQTWHPKFGWLPKGHAARYDAGERFYKGRWIAAEQDARMHAQIDAGWEVESEHFTVTTNHSLEAAVELSSKLERLHRAWRQLFSAYYTSSADLAKQFAGVRVVRANRRKQIVYFRSQEEYQRALRGAIPQQVTTSGIYLGDRRTAYFYATDKPDDATLYHEATHQLFSESRTVAPTIGLQANFWLVEGIACYFESLILGNDRSTLGGLAATRIQDARYRRLKDGFHVPLAALSAMGMQSLQRDERIAKIYSESAGLADFLMHYEGGKYREGLIACLIAVYSGRDRATTLAETLGVEFQTLDEQYFEFLRVTDEDLLAASLPPNLDYLLLAGTRVGDASLAKIAGAKSLRILDLAKTQVTDAGLGRLEGLSKLQSLDLDDTAVTAAAIERLHQRLPQLKAKR